MADVEKALSKACADVRPATEAEGVLGVQPAFVAAPATVEEAAAVMRAAAELGLAVVPRGGETRLDWGSPPSRCELLIDTSGLDRVIEHAAGDLIVKVEAGLPMDRLAEVLAAERQQLALDTPLPGSTVGGTLATAAAGPRRLRYGSPRDLLIGITVVRADGAIAKAGGKVVKNVAGYDLGKLFTGSYGTLGLIVEAAFRLHPVPPAQAYVTAGAGTLAEAQELARQVAHSHAVPSAVEADRPPGGEVALAVLVEGVAAGLPARTADIAAVLGKTAEISEAPPAWWGQYPDGSTLVEISGALPDTDHSLHLRGSIASGRWFLGTFEDPVEAISALRGGAGSAVVRFAPEQVREKVDLWGPVPALTLMRRVKDQFDPEHRMSPGRFAGGI